MEVWVVGFSTSRWPPNSASPSQGHWCPRLAFGGAGRKGRAFRRTRSPPPHDWPGSSAPSPWEQKQKEVFHRKNMFLSETKATLQTRRSSPLWGWSRYLDWQQFCDERQKDVLLTVPYLLVTDFHAASQPPPLPPVTHENLWVGGETDEMQRAAESVRVNVHFLPHTGHLHTNVRNQPGLKDTKWGKEEWA